MLCKKVFLKVSQFHSKTPVLKPFLIKLVPFRLAALLERGSNADVFCEIGEVFKNNCFEEHLWTTASVNMPNDSKGSNTTKTQFKSEHSL